MFDISQFNLPQGNQDLTNAIQFFADKANAAGDLENLKGCIEYVSQYGLWYEVFVVARENVEEDASWLTCNNAIDNQMCEWDL